MSESIAIPEYGPHTGRPIGRYTRIAGMLLQARGYRFIADDEAYNELSDMAFETEDVQQSFFCIVDNISSDCDEGPGLQLVTIEEDLIRFHCCRPADEQELREVFPEWGGEDLQPQASKGAQS